MSRLTLIIYLAILNHPFLAQNVSFIREPGLLNPVSGFTAYSDCAVDMNDDHLDDIVRTGNKGIYIDFQQLDGSYSQQFFPVSIISPPSWSICAGDLDNNGFNDLLFGHLGTVSFLSADGQGKNYTETVMPGFIASQRSTLADINNDGWLDGFVCNDTAQSIPYRNDGTGHMSPDFNLIQTAALAGNYSAIWTDFDNDHDTDLYLSKCLGGTVPGDPRRINLLYRNNGDGTFDEIGQQAGVDDHAQSWSTAFEDFDNDGDFDAFVVNHDMQNRLYRNNGDGTFTDIIGTSGINATDPGALEVVSGDFNNDGFVDIFSDLTDHLYLGNGDLTFTGQNTLITPGAIADLNNDGFLDVTKNGQIWLNEGNEHHWLKIIPGGITSNRNGIGARIEIFGAWGKQTREIRSGQSYTPMSSLIAHFGLGEYTLADSLKIFWPSGKETNVYDLIADSLYFIPEVSCVLPGLNEISVEDSIMICPGDTTILIAPFGYVEYLWSNKHTDFILPVHLEGTYSVISVDSSGCATLSQTVDIIYRKDSPPLIYSAEGNVICQLDSIELISSPGEHYLWSDGESVTSTFWVSESGTYTVSIDAQCADERLESEPFEVFVLSADQPEILDTAFLPGDTIVLTADRANCIWYDLPDGGNPITTGPILKAKSQGQVSTFYVESNYRYDGENMSGGKMDTTGEGGISAQSGFLFFSSWANFTLLSVDIFIPEGAPLNNRFVQLWQGDSVVAFKQFEVTPGINVLELGFHISPGEYSLRCQQGNIWRNTGILDYPYPIGNVGSITTSSFGEGFYYYFYNWQIKTDDMECTSARLKVEVIQTATSVPEFSNQLRVFPNPFIKNATIEIPETMLHPEILMVSDLNGHVLVKLTLEQQKNVQLDLTNLVPGVYMLQVLSGTQSAVTRLVKQ